MSSKPRFNQLLDNTIFGLNKHSACWLVSASCETCHALPGWSSGTRTCPPISASTLATSPRRARS